MKWVHCAGTLLICAGVVAQTGPIDPKWIVVSRPLRWQYFPPEIHMNRGMARAEIMVFYPSGAYGYVACLLIRQFDGSICISHGDGFDVKNGTWTREGKALTVRSRLVYAEVTYNGQQIPGPEVVEQFKGNVYGGYWYIIGPKKRFRPLPALIDLDFLAGLMRDGQAPVRKYEVFIPPPLKPPKVIP